MGANPHGARGLNWHAELTPLVLLAVSAALLLIRLSSRLGLWAYALLAWPGTLAHELSHYLVALMLGASPSLPSLVPRRTATGWQLGSVAFRAGWLRSMPIALAPLSLMPLAAWWAGALLAPATGVAFAVHTWLVAALLSASLPSATDLRLAYPALILAGAMALGWWLWAVH